MIVVVACCLSQPVKHLLVETVARAESLVRFGAALWQLRLLLPKLPALRVAPRAPISQLPVWCLVLQTGFCFVLFLVVFFVIGLISAGPFTLAAALTWT